MKVLFKPNFVRQYKKLSFELQTEVKEKINLFKKDPKHSFLKTHKLKGKLSSYFSFSVNYKYRIVFEYENKETAILLAVGDHDVYR